MKRGASFFSAVVMQASNTPKHFSINFFLRIWWNDVQSAVYRTKLSSAEFRHVTTRIIFSNNPHIINLQVCDILSGRGLLICVFFRLSLSFHVSIASIVRKLLFGSTFYFWYSHACTLTPTLTQNWKIYKKRIRKKQNSNWITDLNTGGLRGVLKKTRVANLNERRFGPTLEKNRPHKTDQKLNETKIITN